VLNIIYLGKVTQDNQPIAENLAYINGTSAFTPLKNLVGINF